MLELFSKQVPLWRFDWILNCFCKHILLPPNFDNSRKSKKGALAQNRLDKLDYIAKLKNYISQIKLKER